jgi:putative iron-regulated protein
MRTARGSLGAWVLLCLSSCGGKPADQPGLRAHALDQNELRAALTNYADIALATYQDSLTRAEELSRACEALVSAASAARLAAAREAWLAARVPYAQSEVFRFYDGPIDQRELWINTWPIDESYVEALPGEESPGIVQDSARYPTLSSDLLKQLNGQAGETAISTGYHVIEFLLWGRDESAEGPGQRSYLDFVATKNDAAGGASLSARRSAYLTLACALLVAQLREVRDAWQVEARGAQNYRATFLALPPPQALYLALKGMAKLSGPELAGERMTVAYETKNQENEHSCFSDSTQTDLLNNALGIENVCLGRYVSSRGVRSSGSGLCGALSAGVPELSTRLTAEVRESARAVAQIPAPFDRAIQGADTSQGRVAIARAIALLRAQAKTLDEIQAVLTLSAPTTHAVAP